MARIIVADLRPLDSEKFIGELTHLEDKYVFGGGYEYSSQFFSEQFFNISLKLIQAFVVTTAIDIISYLTISYLNDD